MIALCHNDPTAITISSRPAHLQERSLDKFNGGYNGTKMALSHGVPLVFAPWGNDQPDVAGRVSWAGAGIKLRVRTPKPAAIAAAVREVLTNPSYAEAARRIAAQFREYGSGGRAATLLERLAGTVQPTR